MFWRVRGKSGGISRAPAWWGQGETQQWPQSAKYLQSAQKQRWVEINVETWPTCQLNFQVQKRKHQYIKEREKKRCLNIPPGVSPHSTIAWAANSNTIITEPAYRNLVLIVYENRGVVGGNTWKPPTPPTPHSWQTRLPINHPFRALVQVSLTSSKLIMSDVPLWPALPAETMF